MKSKKYRAFRSKSSLRQPANAAATLWAFHYNRFRTVCCKQLQLAFFSVILNNMSTIIQLKITLKGTKPPIWRRVLVKDDTTLAKLHGIIQTAMGWENCHLHSFGINGTEFAEPIKGERYVTGENSLKYKLKDLLIAPKQKFSYEYDFGDGWNHDIVVEKFLEVDPNLKYPTCIAGKMCCPPEDCGGVWGYSNIVAAMADKNHPERKEYLEWLGAEFDAEAFDMDDVNKHLR
jgi:Plasmid pRiA4b ORF-3-like protein